MSQFRLVILDFVKNQLENTAAQKILQDIIFVKQLNFLRTDPHYVVMDKHDMIGTHYLIYDVTEFTQPKLVFAIRTTFLERAQQHRIETPLMSLLASMPSSFQEAFQSFQNQHPRLVDCNAWFVDPVFSKKNSGLALSDLGYFLVCTNIMRLGFDNIMGCTNETYKASRWLENVGDFSKDFIFEHPSVRQAHMMILINKFNFPHFAKVYQDYKTLIQETYELMPPGLAVPSIAQFATDVFDIKKEVPRPKAA